MSKYLTIHDLKEYMTSLQIVKYIKVWVAYGSDLIIAIDCVGLTEDLLKSLDLHLFYCDTMEEAEAFSRGVLSSRDYCNKDIKTYIVDDTPKSAKEQLEDDEVKYGYMDTHCC
jgi:hypothetical protein